MGVATMTASGATAAMLAAALRAAAADRCSTSAAAVERGGHDGDVETQPLLAHEQAALLKVRPFSASSAPHSVLAVAMA
jgi:hypothetical protein